MTEQTAEQRAMKARNTERQIHSDTASIVKATKSNELQSTHRVYIKEWLPTYKHAYLDTVKEFFAAKYEGRVRDEDWQIDFDEEQELHVLSLRLWNVKAEWKDVHLAEAHKEALFEESESDDVEVVARNSRKEHMLTSYGKLKLPAAKP